MNMSHAGRILLLPTVLWLIAAGCGQAGFASTPEKQQRSLSLEECIRLALEHNLDLQVARYQPEIARRQVRIAYARYEPSLNASGNHRFSQSPGGVDDQQRAFVGTKSEQDSYDISIGGLLPAGLSYSVGTQAGHVEGSGPGGPFENTSGAVSFQLRQPLLRNLWIDSTRLAIKISRNQLHVAGLSLRSQVMQVITSAEQAYYDLILARENVKVQEQALDLAQHLLAINLRRVELGLLPALDEKQAESQVAVRQSGVQAALRSLVNAEYALKNLLSDEFMEWEPLEIVPTEKLNAGPMLFDLQDSWRKGLTLRPDLLQSQANLERQGIELKFARNQLFPQLDLVGSYGLRGSRREYSGVFGDISRRDSPFYFVGTAITIPLGNRGARENYEIGKAEQERALVSLKRLEQDIMVQIGVAVEQARTALQQVDSTREARRFAEVALEAEQRKLETGKSTSFIVLQLQRDLTAARVAELQALADYNRALAQLALREGTTLRRHGVELEEE
jgi:outer membrane protein